jgi:hypothetical protein
VHAQTAASDIIDTYKDAVEVYTIDEIACLITDNPTLVVSTLSSLQTEGMINPRLDFSPIPILVEYREGRVHWRVRSK